jgi:hypothetical protein
LIYTRIDVLQKEEKEGRENKGEGVKEGSKMPAKSVE